LRKSSLHGYQIETAHGIEKLITNLFADDTTVLLSEHDSFQDLEKILDDWSMAAKAVFNVKKTEIIPIGTRNFREQIIEHRSAGALILPPHIAIAKEGEAKRILGAWFGNGISNEGVWTPTLDKIDADFERW
ncbi:hypothetical protein SCHPADRAFT_795837, partial [Schizopora paradoxa]